MSGARQRGNVMKSGHNPEWKRFTDRVSGISVCQLTDYLGHSRHLYFTESGWYHEHKKLLFVSDRRNATNLHCIDLDNGEIAALTRFRLHGPGGAAMNPRHAKAYFSRHGRLMALDLQTLQLNPVWSIPKGYRPAGASVSSNGAYLCLAVSEAVNHRGGMLTNPTLAIREMHAACPRCRIYRIALQTGQAEMILEDKRWITHVNTSPTQPELLTYCHEGPGDLVANRIWGLDASSGHTWPIRPRQGYEFGLGHEYWYADGVRLGYVGLTKDGNCFFGSIRYDNSEWFETETQYKIKHLHSNDETVMAGDAQEHILVWRRQGKQLDGPRVLCAHGSSMCRQVSHVHPRFSADGNQILYTSDATGYANLYLAQVPDFDDLPVIEETTARLTCSPKSFRLRAEPHRAGPGLHAAQRGAVPGL
ncbi:MAG: oligogalacturonate lyase family protein [Candidatus Marinimicrobia bacterium]|nr:oligogalacturonate lyase family protein [Candidatus Neomarinimicrobiota bacterium]